jgi:hypothetical protein
MFDNVQKETIRTLQLLYGALSAKLLLWRPWFQISLKFPDEFPNELTQHEAVD